MNTQLQSLFIAIIAFALYCLREPWAAVASATFVAGLFVDRTRAYPLVQLGKAMGGAVVTWGIVRLLQEVLR